jgi:hypothetical protein
LRRLLAADIGLQHGGVQLVRGQNVFDELGDERWVDLARREQVRVSGFLRGGGHVLGQGQFAELGLVQERALDGLFRVRHDGQRRRGGVIEVGLRIGVGRR